MAVQTPDEAKELFGKALALPDEDVTTLREIYQSGELSAIGLAGRLLVSPKAAHDGLNQLQEKGLVTHVQLETREIFVSEEEEYFALTEEGEDIVTVILPLVR